MDKEIIHMTEVDLIDLLTGDQDTYWKQTHLRETVVIREMSPAKSVERRMNGLLRWINEHGGGNPDET